MAIELMEWLRTGHLLPLQWGDTAHDLSQLGPTAQAEINHLRASGYPFIVLDGVEFYFSTDGFEDLCEICIKVGTLAKNEHSTYFNYGWLHKGLTNKQVQATLQA
jgi:predicted N-acetyltransferase YhbS